MSVVILGGNECMERQYSNVCRKYGCKAKVFCKPCADMKSRIRKCTDVYRRKLSKGRSLLQLTVRTDRKRLAGCK